MITMNYRRSTLIIDDLLDELIVVHRKKKMHEKEEKGHEMAQVESLCH